METTHDLILDRRPPPLFGADQPAPRTASVTPAAAVARDKSVALVHDWCPSFRGGERVLAELCGMFDAPDVFTLFDFLDREVKDEHFPGVPFHTSLANGLPLVEKYYRALF